jgi:hypothetical protein
MTSTGALWLSCNAIPASVPPRPSSCIRSSRWGHRRESGEHEGECFPYVFAVQERGACLRATFPVEHADTVAEETRPRPPAALAGLPGGGACEQIPGLGDPGVKVGEEGIQGIALGLDRGSQVFGQGEVFLGQPAAFVFAGPRVVIAEPDLRDPVFIAQDDCDLVEVEAEQGLQFPDAGHPGQVVLGVPA